ncbi:uncharacterized protein [Argopecten irradians]|uniref:uncharacterized protein n=1 Tax=Argopecten irradians TaxID=31199 RepID=UPI003720072C
MQQTSRKRSMSVEKCLCGILKFGRKRTRGCFWRGTCMKRLHVWMCVILGSFVIYLAIVTLANVHLSVRRTHDRHKKHTVIHDFVRIKNKIPTTEDSYQFDDNNFQISEQARIPYNVTLTSMSGVELTSLYYRYVNSLQYLCPVKEIFGGIMNGVYTCQLPKKATNCTTVYISRRIHGESRILKEIRDVKGCMVKQILKDDIETALRDGSMGLRRTFMKVVDILIVYTGTGEAYITERLLKKGYLGKVQQLIIKISLTRGAKNDNEIRRRLNLLRSLYQEGFRIYHKEPGPKCIYRLWYTYCYTIYLVRPQPVVRPIVIPEVGTLITMAPADLFRLYHRFALSTQTLCSDNVRVGHIKDGGWNICNDSRHRPVTPCLVYSFGISGDWTFDDQISKLWKCQVHSFDPSIGKTDFNRSARISFHSLGIDAEDRINNNNWQMRTLGSFINLLGHNNKFIDIVKMDVEGSEWPALNQILDSGLLAKVRQLFVEFHTYDIHISVSYLEHLKTFRRLYEQGMRVFWSHPNQVYNNILRSNLTYFEISGCYEIYFINTYL